MGLNNLATRATTGLNNLGIDLAQTHSCKIVGPAVSNKGNKYGYNKSNLKIIKIMMDQRKKIHTLI